MKVLLVGCGSAGKRHLNNLIRIPAVRHIFVYSKVKNCLSGLKDTHKVSLIRSLNDVQVDLAIIANETYKHVDTALALAKKGIHLFIEKPLSHCLSAKIRLLKRISRRNKVILGIGYNLRYLGALKLIKSELSRKTVGDVCFVKIEAGQYLPSWRTGRDYRFSYSASKKRGGGAALDLSHEIDYMRYLFGEPRYWKTVKAKVSGLKIDSDDIFEGVYVYDNFICNVHLDYLQRDKKRIIRIEGNKGRLICDLINKKITILSRGKKRKVTNKKLFDMDKTYSNEISGFVRSVIKNDAPLVTIEDGIRALELIEA